MSWLSKFSKFCSWEKYVRYPLFWYSYTELYEVLNIEEGFILLYYRSISFFNSQEYFFKNYYKVLLNGLEFGEDIKYLKMADQYSETSLSISF